MATECIPGRMEIGTKVNGTSASSMALALTSLLMETLILEIIPMESLTAKASIHGLMEQLILDFSRQV